MKSTFTIALFLFATSAFAQKIKSTVTYTANPVTKEVVIYYNNSSVPADHFTESENPILYRFVAKLQEIVIDLSQKETFTTTLKPSDNL